MDVQHAYLDLEVIFRPSFTDPVHYGKTTESVISKTTRIYFLKLLNYHQRQMHRVAQEAHKSKPFTAPGQYYLSSVSNRKYVSPGLAMSY
jgi:hypothetical protein